MLVAAAVLASPVVAWPWAPLILPGLSPHLAILSAVATRSVGLVALLGLPVLAISLIRRRWFCRHACPVGLILEQAGRLGPASRSWLATIPPLGQWIVLVSLGGVCLGYPLLAWLDPLSLFNGFAGLWGRPITLAAIVAAAGLPCLILLGIALPNVWCRRICPLGATQDILCLPRRLLGRRPVHSLSPPETPARRPWGVARRSLLVVGLGAAWAALVLRQDRRRAAPLRPPGAIDPARFAGLCVRCGNCVHVCPTRILRPDVGEHGTAAFLTPVVRFDENHCLADCNRCTQVCPTGAIARLSLDQKRTARMGRPKLDLSHCLLADNRECKACVDVCPYEAIRIVAVEDEYQSFPKVDPAKCLGCGACQVACPATPKAILIEPCETV